MLGGYRDYLVAVRDALLRGRSVRAAARRRVRGAIGHALAFGTWRSLAHEQRLSDSQTANLMCRLVDVAAGSSARRPGAQRPSEAVSGQPEDA